MVKARRIIYGANGKKVDVGLTIEQAKRALVASGEVMGAQGEYLQFLSEVYGGVEVPAERVEEAFRLRERVSQAMAGFEQLHRELFPAGEG